MMDKIEMYIIGIQENVLAAFKKMNNDDNKCKTLFVCDKDRTFYGTITDGDLRRHIIEDGNLDTCVSKIMNRHPFVSYGHLTQNEDLKKIMENRYISAIPILNEESKLIGVTTKYDNKEKIKPINVPVVIMAGGKGTRLKPFTNILPKPLIPVGDKTITERIMDKFIENGCHDFYLIVNYKKEFIKTYFSEALPDFKIHYIDENEFYGTGGGLSLCKNMFNTTFIMTNCDILIDDSYYKYVEEHKKHGNLVTVVTVKKVIQLPYGVVHSDENGNIVCMEEKPQYTFLTNTGFYIIEPEFVELIPESKFIHMPELLKKCMDKGYRIGTYCIDEQKWMDMGQIDELEKMRCKFEER